MRARERRPRPTIGDAADAARVIRALVLPEQETFVVICLDVRNGMVCDGTVVAVGTAHTVDVHPRDVFREAIRRNAAAIVLGHNHPSGDVAPSESDVEITRRLAEVGALVGIPVVDHVIVGDSHSSIRERRPDAFP